jgi:hypothetical protein
MRVDLCLICAAALAAASCADSHRAPDAITIPDARPACVRIAGAESVNYYLTQSTEVGDSCVLVSFYTNPAARPRGGPFSGGFPAITGPAEYFLGGIVRLPMPCNRARLEPYPGTAEATAGSGTVTLRRVGDDPHALITASLDLTFPAAPDGSRPPSTERVRALDVDTRAPSSAECLNFGG